MSDTARDEMVSVLVSEHGFNEESLDGMGDTCLERTYNSFESEPSDDTEPEEQSANDDTAAQGVPDDVLTRDEAKDLFRDVAEEVVAANRESERREDLVESIVANSDEYDAEALSDTPVDVLETIADDVAQAANSSPQSVNYAAQRGAKAGASTDEDAAADFPALSANERIAEMGDD